jgi:asparagine synthase (glutamine-hydrolysing)
VCGILGLVHREPIDERDLAQRLAAMGLWQYHRGPDGWGEWIGPGVGLGHNRLAIIDLEHGHQPMAAEDGSVQVVFNGEIYNFAALWKELAEKGYRFRTDHSDTEVIVHGYREWGAGVFERLEGMFAIAIWDARRRRLVLARDRAGIKPLYYAANERGLVFASELKTILASGWIEPRMNASALPDYFMFRAAAGTSTLLEGVVKVAPGSWCVYDAAEGIGESRRYWEPRALDRPPTREKTSEELVEEVVEDAAVSHLVSDVPIGLFLSGGVDSSLLAALVAPHARLEAFTVGTRSALDESGFASQVADRLRLQLRVRWVTGDDFRDRFDDWAYFNDDPVADPSALALMLLAEHARESGMKVMLAGEGADELFGGYHSYLRYRAYSLLGAVPALRGGQRLLPAARTADRDYLGSLGDLAFYGSAHVMSARDRQSLFAGETASSILDWEEHAFLRNGGNGDVRSAMVFDQVVRLPNDLLPRTDRATMAYSLEARVPYLDRRVMELANSLSGDACVRLMPPSGKWLLKRVAARHVPRQVVYRRKRGFDLPVARWLTVDFAERVDTFLRERRIDALDYGYLASLVAEHRRGRHRAPLLWAWVVLEQWYRLWIERQATPNQPAIVSDRAAYHHLVAASRSVPSAYVAEGLH